MERVKEEQVKAIVSSKLGVPYIDIDQYEISPEILVDIPEKIAREKKVIPVSKIEGALTVAMANPSDLATVDEIEFLCGSEVITVLASRKGILRAIDRSYPLLKNLKSKKAKKGTKKAKKGVDNKPQPLTTHITDTLPDKQANVPFAGVSPEDLGLGSEVKPDEVMDFMGIFDEENVNRPSTDMPAMPLSMPEQQPMDFYGGSLEDQWAEEIDDKNYKDELTEIWQEVAKNDISQPTTDIINVGSVIVDDVSKVRGAEYDTGEDLTTSIIKQAIAKEASMIYLENSSDGIKMRFRVGNTVEDGDYIEPEYGRALTLHFKRLAGISIHENELPQSGRTPTSIGNKRIMVSVSSLPTISGETVVIKILEEKPWLKLDNLGFSSKVSDQLKKLLGRMRGTILVTGPAKSGKTATMYSILKYFDPKNLKIIDIQSNFEFHIPHISQVQIDIQKGFSSADALSAALEHEPDIVLLEDLHDYLSAEMALRLGLGGLVVTSVRAKSVVESIKKLKDIALDPFLIGTSITCIINQRVVKKICPKCKRKYTPSKAIVDKIKAMAKIKEVFFYKGVGCDNCNNTGFVGETGIFEMVVFNDAIKSAIIGGVPHEELTKIVERNRVRNIWNDAIEKVLRGITTFDEITRVL